MGRAGLAAVLACAFVAPAIAQPRRSAPRRLLDPPAFTIRPTGALAGFVGEGVDVVVAWRSVAEAARYRISVTNLADHKVVDVETTGLRFEKRGLAPGRYELTVLEICMAATVASRRP